MSICFCEVSKRRRFYKEIWAKAKATARKHGSFTGATFFTDRSITKPDSKNRTRAGKYEHKSCIDLCQIFKSRAYEPVRFF